MAFSVGGLASGLDTKSIIQQLMKIDARPKTQLEWKSQLWTARKGAWSDLNTKLQSLQNQANILMRNETWDVAASGTPAVPGTFTATSGDPSRLSATTTGTPAAGTYAVQVLQLARPEISTSSGNLAAATSGQRTTGAWYEGANNVVEGNETITALRSSTGATLGLNTNSRITMNYTVDGVSQTAEFRVNTAANGGDGTTLAQFKDWVATTVGSGASAEFLGSGYGADAGKLRVTTGAGTANELDGLSFTAVNAAGNPLVNFNSTVGASASTQTVAATDGGVDAADTLTIANGAGSWDVGLAAGDGKQQIVDKINATSGIGVFANLVGNEIQLRSMTTGAASAFSVTSTGTTATRLGFIESQTAQDAQYTVNGVGHSSATNMDVTGGIPDVSLNLLGTTSTTLTIAEGSTGPGGGTAEDKWVTRTMDKLSAFVDSYNAVIQFVHQKTQGESRIVNPKNLNEYLQGSMARDVGFSQVALDLRRITTDIVDTLPGGANLLSDIGIT
ncbi:MAG: flagellar filament capping protein FliD, partial [Gaiellales bacterium]